MNAPDEVSDQRSESYFEGDSGTLAADVRAVICQVMARRVFLGRNDPRLWETFIARELAITTHFHNMYIDLIVDRNARLVFKQQVHPEGVDYRVLLREQRATREMSAAILYLRSEYNRQINSGVQRVTVNRADITTEIEAFWPETETNRRARGRSVNAAIRGLVEQDLLLGSKDAEDWEVSPAIQTLYTAEAITRLTDWLTDPDRLASADEAYEDDDDEVAT